ncbi:MAG: glycosyltransferase [Clostridiales bacterium]|nr:glycosyltransferase [Clostridiales bacterium]
MKAVYVYSRIEDNIEASGEAKKAKMQVAALNQLGVETSFYLNDKLISLYKLRIRMPWFKAYSKSFVDEVLNYIRDENIECVYIRKYLIDASFLKFLERLKNQNLIVLLEIPTFPYDAEWKKFVDWPLLFKEKRFRKKLGGLVDRIITYSTDESIFGIKCINSSNGIDTTKVPVREKRKHDDNRIVLLGVATLEKWHGYDRLIRGISTYNIQNPDIRVEFDIVGEGAEFNNLKKLADNLNLNEYIHFHGFLSGQQLTDLFEKADIGVGSLGMYRIGLYEGYTLKLREYMSRGLPFIYAYDDNLIERTNCDYFIKFSNDNTEINIDNIVQFYQKVRNQTDVEKKMHGLAEKYLTWNSQMKPIADYLEEKMEEMNND